jgi:hypothetical protein
MIQIRIGFLHKLIATINYMVRVTAFLNYVTIINLYQSLAQQAFSLDFYNTNETADPSGREV